MPPSTSLNHKGYEEGAWTAKLVLGLELVGVPSCSSVARDLGAPGHECRVCAEGGDHRDVIGGRAATLISILHNIQAGIWAHGRVGLLGGYETTS